MGRDLNERETKALGEEALSRLYATKDDEEEWSYLFRTEGSGCVLWYPSEKVEDEDFYWEAREMEGLWSKERIEAIGAGRATPNGDELKIWRAQLCQRNADNTDYAYAVWTVPVSLDGGTSGYAMFLCEPDAYRTPELRGVFSSVEVAHACLRDEGALSTDCS